ncbi:MAG: peptidylprolyl isomerase, partial [Verrucomicrobia bacterium]|nr:peptidylprolyl isomerase [Verrucomicrobiota bacterium]
DRPHVRGVLSAARSQDPDSAGCQFFICLADAKFLDRQYTAFGKLIGGDDVLEAIGSVETTFAGGREKSRPTRRMSVESVQIVPRDSVKV